MGPRRSTVSSEFPSGIDRIANTHAQKHEQRAPPIPISKNIEDQTVRLTAINRSMGDMMAKCISLLENEIFPEPSPPEKKQQEEEEAINKLKEDLQNVPENEKADEVEKQAENADQDVASYDSSSSSISEEKKKKDIIESSTKQPGQNDATIIMALAGLKHVRDILLGKQAHFDATVIDIKLDGSTPDSTSNGDEWKWDLVDHKEVGSAAFTPSSPPAAISTKRASATIFVPPQTSSSLISADMDSPTFEKDQKPLPPIQQYQRQQPIASVPPITTASFVEEQKLPQVPITYISTNPTPPKQQVKYRIEDLLSDPDLQLPSPKASANAKFKWMLENENNATDTQLSSSSLGNSGSGSGQELFKSEQQKLSPRKRSSFIIKKPVSGKANESAIDPLDARNVDSRKSYEYDML